MDMALSVSENSSCDSATKNQSFSVGRHGKPLAWRHHLKRGNDVEQRTDHSDELLLLRVRVLSTNQSKLAILHGTPRTARSCGTQALRRCHELLLMNFRHGSHRSEVTKIIEDCVRSQLDPLGGVHGSNFAPPVNTTPKLRQQSVSLALGALPLPRASQQP
ncbi:hypothetical protein Mapa_005886 [Marchantia paleacea]|nr:hypothetical protein Mapa_005886 [Marchantia paleacea]